uniref:Uncharacterized protein n=1 Tax=Emiliania huxleyi TaxID=2903 RepID=A0A6V2LZ39_EMIHU|mmetsp:Transcript_15391/g.45815  ORF Transcript_15391/g.45815 Transcript_15391/m.45815 type:complete len:217 (+) Transcript_15391:116-766(+)
MLPSILGIASKEMRWNKQPIPYSVALQIGWNLPIDVVGAGVYGGIVKRDSEGRVLIGDEWPEDNLAPPAHNPIHRTGPYLDYARLTADNRGYTSIAQLIMDGRASKLDALLESVPEANGARKRLANLVMTGGARPLHMCGMGRGGDTSELIKVLIRHGADVNAKDNYEMTPMERLSSNMVAGNDIMKAHGGVTGRRLPRGAPDWSSDAFVYSGPGE